MISKAAQVRVMVELEAMSKTWRWSGVWFWSTSSWRYGPLALLEHGHLHINTGGVEVIPKVVSFLS